VFDEVVLAFEGECALVDVVLVVEDVLVVDALLEEAEGLGPVAADHLVLEGEGLDELLQDPRRVLPRVLQELV
jgi:hypothetical protein